MVNLDNKRTIRFSKFAHRFQKDDVTAFYHSLSFSTLFLNASFETILAIFQKGASEQDALAQVSPGNRNDMRQVIQSLLQRKLLVDAQSDETQELRELQSLYLSKPEIGVLYLSLTDGCNAACSYCFIVGGLPKDFRPMVMSKTVAQQALDLYSRALSSNAGRKTIVFYGGEPLINGETFKFCLEYVSRLKEQHKLPDDVALTMNTNGTLITEEIADLMKRHNVAVSISLDGMREIHDACRPNKSGQGTFDKALAGYKILKDKGVNTGISCTVGAHNIEQLPEIVEWFISELKIDFLGLNQLTDLPGRSLSPDGYMERFSEMAVKSFLIARENGLYEDRMMRKVEAFVSGNVYPFDCAGCGRQIVVMPDGSVGVCHAYTGTREYFSSTPIERINPYEEKVWLEWCGRSPLGMPECFSCPSLGICGGGCPYNADINHGSIWEKDRKFCLYADRILQWLIWELYEHASQDRQV